MSYKVLNTRTHCSVCGNKELEELVCLPNLPITGLFAREVSASPSDGVDQSLLWCINCGQGQLKYQIDPGFLYDSAVYSFKTSASATARAGTQVFIDFIKTVSKGKRFECAVDIGCNDLYLLKEIEPIAKIRIGIDPIWEKQPIENADEFMKVIGGVVEDIDLEKALPQKPGLIISRHTMEHIYDPLKVMEKIMAYAGNDTLFVFEFPAFESLLENNRFDHVFHEHLQYYSLASWEYLLNRIGAEIIGYTENFQNWGAILIAFRKKTINVSSKKRYNLKFSKTIFDQKLRLFESQMRNTKEILDGIIDYPLYGYGAALMLPVLAYHLKSDLSFLKAVLDDDEGKDGLFYRNLPLQIRHSSRVSDLGKAAALVTAVDNFRPIAIRLQTFKPRQIIYPFHLI